MPREPWFPFSDRTSAAPARIFCIPHAGGSAAAFRPWIPLLGERAQVCPIEPPGRATRFAEPAHHRLEPYVEALATAMRPWLDRPYLLLGHSLGALIAFELTRALAARGAPLPARLLLSGREGPRLSRERGADELGDDALVGYLKTYAGTPAEVFENPELLQLILPVVRADFTLLAHWRFDPAAKVSVAATAIGGAKDPEVPPATLEAWREVADGPFDVRVFPGGHFYLYDAPEPVIASAILPFLSPPRFLGVAR